MSKHSTDSVMMRAQWLINAPVLLMMAVPTALIHYYVDDRLGVTALTFLGGMLAGSIYWSYITPRWLLWAFARVEDPYELRQKAQRAKVLWPHGHWMERLMLWTLTATQRKGLATWERIAAAPSPVRRAPSASRYHVRYRALDFWWIMGSYALVVTAGLSLFVGFLRDASSWGNGALAALLLGGAGYGWMRPIPLLDAPAIGRYIGAFRRMAVLLAFSGDGFSCKAQHTGLIAWTQLDDFELHTDERSKPVTLRLHYYPAPDATDIVTCTVDLRHTTARHRELMTWLRYYLHRH